MILNGWGGLILLLSFTFGTDRFLTCSAFESYGDRHQNRHNRIDHEGGDYVDTSDMRFYFNFQPNVNGQRRHERYSASGTEDLKILNKISSEPNSRIFRDVSPVPTIGFYEYFKETFGFEMFYSMKFWQTLFSVFVVLLLTVILLVQTYAARSPVEVIFYAITILFILSCVWAFCNFYESSKAINAARLHQYQAVPKDCNFDNFGYFDTCDYYIRIHLLGYEDRCEQYHKETLIDPFYKTSPAEAISDTLSKLIFHPMSKFFGEIIAAVPFWLQPIVLVLIFIFGFFLIFIFANRTLFLSIKTVQRVRPQLEGSPLWTQQVYPGSHQQIIERPSAQIVRAASKQRRRATFSSLGQNYLH